MVLRERNKIRTRERILKTARHMFRENGYEETMVNDIADSAHVARQTLYNYFPSKGSLLVGIAEEEMVSLEKMFTETVDTDASATERIRLLLESYILDAVSYLVLTRRIVFLINSFEEEPGKTQARIRSMLICLVVQAKSEGSIRADIEIDTAVDSLLGVYYSVLYETPLTEPNDEEACRKRVGRMLDIVFDGLR
ncbi:MAG: TetR/AcrR family transcriptional regulator [Clostridiales Family XIII bacterium]|jgi:AcrR family transcriptional regulator|nr:TetR/AcrR family transcriptional regulator [Clostridiales Family XIII bacterium]